MGKVGNQRERGTKGGVGSWKEEVPRGRAFRGRAP